MTEYVTGQIYGWNGGECTVHPKTVVQVWLRSGGVKAANAQVLVWDHNQNGSDIVCFQVITPHDEPKTIWVNECESGCGTAYCREEEAKRWAHKCHARIAVEYVEVKK